MKTILRGPSDLADLVKLVRAVHESTDEYVADCACDGCQLERLLRHVEGRPTDISDGYEPAIDISEAANDA